MPMQSINHTNFWLLRNVPLAVSIDTKRSGRPEEDADVQAMTRQAAQWKLLRGLVANAQGGDTKLLDELPCLPAVIVYGHDWRFAACGRDGNKTVRLHSFLPFVFFSTTLG